MPRLITETFGTGDPSWLDSTHGIYECRSINLDLSAFTENTHYPDGYIPSGTPLGEIAATGKYGPYGGNANEVQAITPASVGNTTVVFDGESTGAITIAADAGGVTTLQTALNGLSNINPGDVTVSLGSGDNAGDLLLTFGGQYTGTNVPEVTVSGTGTAKETVTAGGSTASNGQETFVGFLRTDTPTDGVEDVNAPIFEHGRVEEANLPIAIDAKAKSDNPRISYV